MNRLDGVSRASVREALTVDERIEHSTQLGHLLEEIGLEVVKLERLLAQVSDDYATPVPTLKLVARLAKSKRIRRSAAVIDFLLSQAGERSVLLARVHGATWQQVADAIGEAEPNLVNRMKFEDR